MFKNLSIFLIMDIFFACGAIYSQNELHGSIWWPNLNYLDVCDMTLLLVRPLTRFLWFILIESAYYPRSQGALMHNRLISNLVTQIRSRFDMLKKLSSVLTVPLSIGHSNRDHATSSKRWRSERFD